MRPGKAPAAANGLVLGKDGNAEWVHLGASLRAGRGGAIHRVASFDKGRAIVCETRLVADPFPARCIRNYHVDGVLGTRFRSIWPAAIASNPG